MNQLNLILLKYYKKKIFFYSKKIFFSKFIFSCFKNYLIQINDIVKILMCEKKKIFYLKNNLVAFQIKLSFILNSS
jgi:hypothetical protein